MAVVVTSPCVVLLICVARANHLWQRTMSVLGLRVIRGPDWTAGDEDGGEGHVGTVTQLLGNYEVRVLWDMGAESTCRAGVDGKHDLRVLDTAQIGEGFCLSVSVSLVRGSVSLSVPVSW